MNVAEYDDSFRTAMVKLDNTEDIIPGDVLEIAEEAYMVLNHYDCIVIPYTSSALH
jgi:hypothetical protein